ncbi:HAD-IIIA family hydrolase [Shewanella sp. NIFS-20-20]|uniref:HAD-IIIA family hydrolase n=1 Tax=Shewanella sp. NIFS-20-20 TaxID=2853806 RepID=UPI001C466096|nr:HAD-IIIA family hydrolase [Shewanella sp. NIFS-20-20]MBV7314355.1 HAD-IIIA family hydrolase [Shewanella sp. NIFS-20-20]
MQRQFDLIVFDWDGTLMDSIGKIIACVEKLAEHISVPVPEDEAIRAIIGLSLSEALATLFPEVDMPPSMMTQVYQHQFKHVELMPTPLFTGVESLLQQLTAQGYTLAVATGKSRAGLDACFERTALSHYFAASRCSDECAGKPHPQMLQELLAQLAVAPERAVMVGDSRLDIQMGNKAGMATIAVTYGAQTPALLALEQPTAMVDSIAQLGQWLLQ